MDETETQSGGQANLDYLASPLDTEKRTALELVCNDLGLNREAFECIEFEARLLRDFESHKKPVLQTPRERVKAFKNVEKLAKELQAAINELGYQDRLLLGEEMAPEAVPSDPHFTIKGPGYLASFGGVKHHQPTYSIHDGGRVGYVGLEAEKLAEACNAQLLRIGDHGKSGGRKSVQQHYVWHLSAIKCAVENTSIKIGRGGSFERLCNAVFVAADVPANSEGALRIFLKEVGTDFERF
ncbi:hypothetical protein [Rhodoferax fermentans]|uniref:Uncharacterized protein n=1 Tax=Rhodoferax fermentans TaxID=28066 RepID=A0A1T1AVP0_RHOFE|nr:hypothetical protein [Rhodoferax fermentans]MBK1685187.1 hypothetical protein [Rhodoferax fermentans]OOV08179.1 hypothetical protein RF819_16935 [Rhodoferax fermentans]